MGLGRNWREQGSGAVGREMEPGEVALHADVAADLGVGVGNYLTVAFRVGKLSRHIVAPPDPCPVRLPPGRGGVPGARGVASTDNDVSLALEHANASSRCDGWSLTDQRFGVVVGRVRLARTFTAGAGGKVSNADATGTAIAPLAGTARWAVQEGLHPAVRWAGADGADAGEIDGSTAGEGSSQACGGDVPAIACASIAAPGGRSTGIALPRASGPDVAALQSEWFVSAVHLAMAPDERVDAYASPNFDEVQARIGDFAADALYAAGFSQLSSSLGVLDALREGQFVTLYLGLVLDVLLAVLFALATVLIYSLLLINTSGRRFEVGVRRMLGQTRPSIVGLLGLQAAAYSVPAWVTGLVAAQLVASAVLGNFADLAGLGAGGSALRRLSSEAIVTATVLALAIPALAAIVPIRQALTEDSLREAADASRPSGAQKVVEVTVERSAGSSPPIAALIAGIVAVGFGFGIYYVLPLSLLSLNLRLFFNLFLAVLLGLMAGLVALAMNLEAVVEQVVSVLLLSWWEAEAVVNLALANLAAHRTRNQKTLAMYALSIAFIVFVFVAASQEVQTAEFTTRQALGSPVVLQAPPAPAPQESMLVAETALAAASAGHGAAWASVADDVLATQPDPSAPMSDHREWSQGVVRSLEHATALQAGQADATVLPPGVDRGLADAWAGVGGLTGPVRWVSRSGLGNSRRGLGIAGWEAVSSRFESRAIARSSSGNGADASGDDASVEDGASSSSSSSGGGGGGGGFGGLVGGGSSLLQADQDYLFPAVLLRSVSRLGTASIRPFAVSPGVESSLDEAYLRYASATRSEWSWGEDRHDGLGLTRGLYGARGGQRAVLSASLRLQLPGWRRGDRALVTTTEEVPADRSGGARTSQGSIEEGEPVWQPPPRGSSSSSAAAPAPAGAAVEDGQEEEAARARSVFAARSLALGPSSRAPRGQDYVATIGAQQQQQEEEEEEESAIIDEQAGNATEVAAVQASLWASRIRSASLLRSSALFSFSRTGEEETSALASFPAFLDLAAARGRHVAASYLPLWRGLWSVPGGAAPESAAGRAAAGDAEKAAEAAEKLAIAVSAPFLGAGGAQLEGPHKGWAAAQDVVGEAEALEAKEALRGAYLADAVAGSFAASQGTTAQDVLLFSDERAAAWGARSVSSDLGDLSAVLAAINFLFAVLAVVVMFLCFFSLLASVATNIREQQREIGVLRAVGLSPSRLARLYAHEASLLVAAAALLGTGVGTASAWAFAQQRSLFTGLPLALVFPWSIVAAVVIVSFVCGLLASCAPARAAGQERITKLTAGGG